MKKADDYEINETVWEGDCCLGRVVFVLHHPTRPIAYLLLETADAAYTIYGCCMDARSNLFLVRNIPKSIMVTFLFEAFLNGGASKTNGHKEPVRLGGIEMPPPKESKTDEADESMAGEDSRDTDVPGLDFLGGNES